MVALCKNGARVDAMGLCGNTPLHLAAAAAVRPKSAFAPRGASAAIVNILLKAGADAESINKIGRSPVDQVRFGSPSHPQFRQDIKPVLDLLQSPDMVWRRRGVWILCRAYPGREEVEPESAHSKLTRMAGNGSGGL